MGLRLYGVMPPSVEHFLARRIEGWPTLYTGLQSQRRRQTLLRRLTASRGHLDSSGRLQFFCVRCGALAV